MNGDFEVARVSLGKEYFEKSDNGNMSSNELLKLSNLYSDSSNPIYRDATFQPKINFPEF